MYLLLLNKNPLFNKNPPLFKEFFSNFKNGLITPPSGTENLYKDEYFLNAVCDAKIILLCFPTFCLCFFSIIWFCISSFISRCMRM